MATLHDVERARRDGTLFGIPMGDLGWFQSLIIGLASGMTAFFLSTFLAIMGFLIYFAITRHPLDFAVTYKRIGFPIGVVVGVFMLGYLAVLYAKRMARKGRGETPVI